MRGIPQNHLRSDPGTGTEATAERKDAELLNVVVIGTLVVGLAGNAEIGLEVWSWDAHGVVVGTAVGEDDAGEDDVAEISMTKATGVGIWNWMLEDRPCGRSASQAEKNTAEEKFKAADSDEIVASKSTHGAHETIIAGMVTSGSMHLGTEAGDVQLQIVGAIDAIAAGGAELSDDIMTDSKDAASSEAAACDPVNAPLGREETKGT
jgi:hypothetical protein